MALATALFQYVPELIEPTVRAKIERALNSIVRDGVPPAKLAAEVKAEFAKYFEKLQQHRREIKEALEKALNSSP